MAAGLEAAVLNSELEHLIHDTASPWSVGKFGSLFLSEVLLKGTSN